MRESYRVNPTDQTVLLCNPLLVVPPLAERIGLNHAIFLQQVHYWLLQNFIRENHIPNAKHRKDGRWWSYNTYEEWQKNNFPFWSLRTIKRIVDDLREMGLLITTSRYNTLKGDRTLWYTINYQALQELFPEHGDIASPYRDIPFLCPPDVKELIEQMQQRFELMCQVKIPDSSTLDPEVMAAFASLLQDAPSDECAASTRPTSEGSCDMV